jgi:O-acetyl-ADP-ribose deacetylase (regulator of RNase III)
MIEFTSGDILKATTEYIAHGVATGSQEGLGTGLAFKISSKWPDVQKQFKKYSHSNRFQGGDIFVVTPTADRVGVIYMATQPDMYHASVRFLNRSLRNLERHCSLHHVRTVALPKIGAGLGKLDWITDVKPLFLRHLASTVTLFQVYEDFKLQYEDKT